MPQTIDFHEDNFGMGDHRTWSRKDREAWHVWAAHPIEECDCNVLD